MKRLILGCAVLALVGGSAGEARAGLLPAVSDQLDFFVGGTNFASQQFFETSDTGDFAVQRLVIELLDPGTQIISDVLTISSLLGTFTSDSNEAGLPATPGAIQVGELFTALEVRVQSDLGDQGTAPSNSDVVQFFFAGNSQGSITIAEDPTRAESFTFTLAQPVTFDMLEADGTVSDKLVISQFSGSFASDDDPSTMTHTRGAFSMRPGLFKARFGWL